MKYSLILIGFISLFVFTASCGSKSSSKSFSKKGSSGSSGHNNLNISITSPEANSVVALSNQNAYTIQGTCEAGTTVEASGAASGSATCTGGGTFSLVLDFSGQADGNMNLTITITDSAGNTGTDTIVLVRYASICEGAANGGSAPFHYGSGTSIDPYVICTLVQFEAMRAHLAANGGTGHYYKIGDNIDAGGATINPLGSLTLTDNLDGTNLTLSNFIVGDGPAADATGLFVSMNGNAEINDFRISDASLPTATSGNDGAGILVGRMEGAASIDNTHIYQSTMVATGTNTFRGVGGMVGKIAAGSTVVISNASSDVTFNNVVSTELRIGGLVGWMESGSISDSFATGGITAGLSLAGGLVGLLQGGSVNNSYAEGNITTAGSNVGGAIGFTSPASLTITGVYATGDVTTSLATAESVGGLIGRANGANLTLIDCYATGNVDGSAGADYVGGLVGQVADRITVETSYATGNVIGEQYIGGLLGFAIGTTVSITDSYALGDVTANGTNADAAGLMTQGWGATAHNITRSFYAEGVLTATGSGTAYALINAEDTPGAVTITDSYYDTTANAGATSQGVGRTNTEMKDTANRATIFSGFNFTTIWQNDSVTNLPILR